MNDRFRRTDFEPRMSAKFAGTEIEIRLGSNVRYRRFGIKTGQSGYDPIADIGSVTAGRCRS